MKPDWEVPKWGRANWKEAAYIEMLTEPAQCQQPRCVCDVTCRSSAVVTSRPVMSSILWLIWSTMGCSNAPSQALTDRWSCYNNMVRKLICTQRNAGLSVIKRWTGSTKDLIKYSQWSVAVLILPLGYSVMGRPQLARLGVMNCCTLQLLNQHQFHRERGYNKLTDQSLN